MAQQTKVKLSQSKLELEGVQVTLTVHVGDWVRSVAISPVDYKIFKKWDEIYAEKVIESIVNNIEHELDTTRKSE